MLLNPGQPKYKISMPQMSESSVFRAVIASSKSIADGITAKEWREKNTSIEGNIRDNATLEQLVVLSNMESINALLIRQGLTQNERLIHLNKTAIAQMRSLLESNTMKKLK